MNQRFLNLNIFDKNKGRQNVAHICKEMMDYSRMHQQCVADTDAPDNRASFVRELPPDRNIHTEFLICNAHLKFVIAAKQQSGTD